MQAIPTLYKGRQYRSRLEARWAAFFDLVGWQYEYEPFDLPGWIPDFLLVGAMGEILVEVKPTGTLSEFPLEKINNALMQAQKDSIVLLLGPGIEGGWSQNLPIIGFLSRKGYVGEAILIRLEILKNDDSDNIGIPSSSAKALVGLHNAAESDFSRDPITGLSPNFLGGISLTEATAKWNEAGNLVQWKAPSQTRSQYPTEAIQEAKTFLLTVLNRGTADVATVKKQARQAGIDSGALHAAKAALKIETRADDAGWSWFLPGKYQVH